jgi:hypothetical protein
MEHRGGTDPLKVGRCDVADLDDEEHVACGGGGRDKAEKARGAGTDSLARRFTMTSL